MLIALSQWQAWQYNSSLEFQSLAPTTVTHCFFSLSLS